MPYTYGYSDRDRGVFDKEDEEEGVHHDDDENDGIKPYTAVGATLDSATRFKRRMNYGRTPKKS